MPYRFPEDTATADIAIEVYAAKDLEELVNDALHAMIEIMADPSTVQPKQEAQFSIEALEPDRLVHDVLEELIFLKDADTFIFHEISAKVVNKERGYVAFVTGRGEETDISSHNIGVDVKAVTWHHFVVEQKEDGTWYAFIILDV